MIHRLLSALVLSSALSAAILACGEGDPTVSEDGHDASRSPAADSDADSARDSGLDDTEPDATVDGAERGLVEAIAGSSATGWVDGLGTDARFNGPSGGVVLPDGSTILVADTFNAVIRRIDASGAVTTVAGRVQVQATADGVGTSARFQSPRAMVAAPDGSAVYVADGPTVRKVALPGYQVTTLAGTPGAAGFADGTGPVVRLGFLLHALEVSADGSTLFIADRSNKALRTLNLATGEVKTVAGAPYAGAVQHVDGVGVDARFSGVGGLARVGNELFVADTFNHALRRVALDTFAVTTVAGAPGTAGVVDGTAAESRFDTPQGVVVSGGYLYSTSFGGVLRRVSLDEFSVTTILGVEGDARSVDGVGAAVRLGAAFAQPMAPPSGTVLWYQDRSASSIRKIDLATLAVSTFAGSKEPEATLDGSLLASRFESPSGLAASADGKTWLVSDSAAHLLRRIDLAAGVVGTLAGKAGEAGTANGSLVDARFSSPGALAWDESRGIVYVVDSGSRTVRSVNLASGAVETLSEANDGEAQNGFVQPSALSLDPVGARLYVSDIAQPSPSVPAGRAAVHVIDLTTKSVSLVAGSARAAAPVDGPVVSATFHSPSALAFDGQGNRLYVAERSRSTIRVIDFGSGTVATVAGRDGEQGPADGRLLDARFNAPSGLVFSAGENALYVTDSSGHTIRRLDLIAKKVSTWLGDPSRNGGLAPGKAMPFAEAPLYFPNAPVIAAGDLGFVSEHAVYRARPSIPIAP